MSGIKTKKIQGGFRTPKLPVYKKRYFDLANLDLKKDAKFNKDRLLKQTGLERQVESTVHGWLRVDEPIRQVNATFKNSSQLKDFSKILRRADRILRIVNPVLQKDPRIPM